MRAGALLLSTLTLLAGCGGGGVAPVVSRTPERSSATVTTPAKMPAARRSVGGRLPAVHVVEKGDTLYSIAWRYGLDYRQVADWNAIHAPFIIVPGQHVLLRQPPSRAPPPALEPRVGVGAAPPAAVAPRVPAARATTEPVPARATNTAAADALHWRWPARGRIRDATTPLGTRALQVVGQTGQAIYAAAPGQVVYSGSGLIGYGKLIIIKHNDTYLSAYAHNDKLLVNEGATVAAGDKIAEMGSSGAKEVMLHFEIRRNGKPVPPLDYLPKS
ncbi:MAG: peptidoglycan DD-metalloendopeptidase family protein [Gammaproteobacteria bacterium]|nr:peptidoglycan DD-metalloendopeptidase family protein [Gammaproteobacteria bacterium]